MTSKDKSAIVCDKEAQSGFASTMNRCCFDESDARVFYYAEKHFPLLIDVSKAIEMCSSDSGVKSEFELIQIRMNFSSHWWPSSSSSDCSSESEAWFISIRRNCRSSEVMAALDALVFLLFSVWGRVNGDDMSTECDFHERVSSEEDPLLLKAFRNLSTNRLWNLFKLFWLPTFAGFGGDVLWTYWLRVGLMMSEDCEFLELTRENWYRDPADETWCKLRCDGEFTNASFVPGDVESEWVSEAFLDRPLPCFAGIDRLFPFALFIL